MLSELSILEKEINEYLTDENNVANEYEERKQLKVSYKLPAVINLESKCKTIFQKANHIEQTLIDIVTEFYPKFRFNKTISLSISLRKVERLVWRN